jgi:hypothetical protein
VSYASGKGAEDGDLNPMAKDTEYRDLAAAGLDLAKRAANLEDKLRRLTIAEAWLSLANRVEPHPVPSPAGHQPAELTG